MSEVYRKKKRVGKIKKIGKQETENKDWEKRNKGRE